MTCLTDRPGVTFRPGKLFLSAEASQFALEKLLPFGPKNRVKELAGCPRPPFTHFYFFPHPVRFIAGHLTSQPWKEFPIFVYFIHFYNAAAGSNQPAAAEVYPKLIFTARTEPFPSIALSYWRYHGVSVRPRAVR